MSVRTVAQSLTIRNVAPVGLDMGSYLHTHQMSVSIHTVPHSSDQVWCHIHIPIRCKWAYTQSHNNQTIYGITSSSPSNVREHTYNRTVVRPDMASYLHPRPMPMSIHIITQSSDQTCDHIQWPYTRWHSRKTRYVVLFTSPSNVWRCTQSHSRQTRSYLHY